MIEICNFTPINKYRTAKYRIYHFFCGKQKIQITNLQNPLALCKASYCQSASKSNRMCYYNCVI